MAQPTLYVDPTNGQDQRDGRSPAQSLKTLTAALRLSQGNAVIQLAAGLYTANQGEQFPLVIPAGCEIVGVMGGDRPATVLQGSGGFQDPVLGMVAVTCQVAAAATLKNIAIVNTQAQGVGVAIVSGRPHFEKVVVSQCPQYGAAVLGTAIPTLQDCIFEACGIAGIAFFSQSRGHLERVFCQKNRAGLLVQDAAAPLVQACGLERNTIGLAIAGTAHPVLRATRLVNNQTYGLELTERGTADLGQAHDEGQNHIRHNGQQDIQNRTGQALISCGNDVVPQRLQGPVTLIASELPAGVAVPALLFEQPASFADDSSPAAEPSPAPAPGSVRFRDLASHWAAPFVDGLAQAGAVAGFQDGTFRPDQPVTRAEFAALVVASFGDRPATNPGTAFTDVPREFWAYGALSQGQRLGFLGGFPDGTMRPQEPITRIQAIVAIANGLGLTGGRVDEIGIYRDRAQVPSYAVDALASATQQRLVVNYPDPLVLRPLEPMNRGEVAALIYQGRVVTGQASAIASTYIVQPDTTQPLFSDLTGHWAAAFIRGLATANLVNGMADGRFAPDAPMNRAQFAALVVNAFQPAPVRPAIAFRDVPTDYWGAAAIQAAYRGEFMAGFPDQTFAPEHRLLRVQTWVALVNGLGWDDPAVNLNPLGRFADYTDVPRYALSQAAIAAARHLIANHPDPLKLRPNQIATRAEVCVAVYQALVAQQRLPAIAASYLT